MADLASSLVKVNTSESAQNAPVSEATAQKIGSTANGLIDGLAALNALNILTSTPMALAFTSISGNSSYTTPNTKQIYAVLAVSIGSSNAPSTTISGALVRDAFIIALQGRAGNWLYNPVSSTNQFARSLTVGGTNNRTVTQACVTNTAESTTYLMVAYEP